MDSNDKTWKTKVGFPINYDSDQSSEENVDATDVVVRHSRLSASYLLADGGDGSEADLLGTTPPRTRIRSKEKRKTTFDSVCGQSRVLKDRRNSDYFPVSVQQTPTSERLKRRSTLKLLRSKERDLKQNMSQSENKADSMPPSNALPAIPTLVESCNRFMSLTSRLKCREAGAEAGGEGEEAGACERRDELPQSRVEFHNMFSMLIKMGNAEKGARRAISREEQVWQNELKDLIWLGLQARVAGRSLAQQDAWLCAARAGLPSLLQRLQRFSVTPDCDCAALQCGRCSRAVGDAARRLRALLDEVHAARALYPSRAALALEHPAFACPRLDDRLKAMCLWYNVVIRMRTKILSLRRLLRGIADKRHRLVGSSADIANFAQSDTHCASQVRFKMETSSTTPTDSSNSNSSSDGRDRREGCNGTTTDSQASFDQHDIDHVDSNTTKHSERLGAESPHSTADESGYSSEDGRDDVYELGDLADLTRLRLLGNCEVSPYRTYHNEILKTQGVRRSMVFIEKMKSHLLGKVYYTFEKLESPEPDTHRKNSSNEVFEDSKHDEEHADIVKDEEASKIYEMKRYGCWSEESLSMGLPSYRNHFLLLNCICMEVVHDYLELRLEGKPENPSCLTIKQLIHELKEGLDIATEMRAEFVANVTAAKRGWGAGGGAGEARLALRAFDRSVRAALQQFLGYVRAISLTETLPRAALDAEWAFAARLAQRHRAVAALAPPVFAEIACNQMKRILKQFEKDFEELSEMEKREEELDRPKKMTVYGLCRAAQQMYSAQRERTLQAAQWARVLAARLARAPRAVFLRQRDEIFCTLMALRGCIVRQTSQVLERSSAPVLAADDPTLPRVRELLLQIYKLGFELHKHLYKFVHSPAKASEAQSHRPTSLQPARNPTLLKRRRPETMIVHESIDPLIHKELHRFVKDSSPTPVNGSQRPRLGRADSVAEDDTMFQYSEQAEDEAEADADGEAEAGAGVELREGAVERRWAKEVAHAVVAFARCWMKFVKERCDRGRGLRPRWASQGLEFLMLACDPHNTKHLTEEEFEELKQLMDECISHVVGSRRAPDATPAPPRALRTIHSPLSSAASTPVPKEPSSPSTPSGSDAPPNFQEYRDPSHNKRVLEAIEELERSREAKLRSLQAIGRELPSHTPQDGYEPRLRQVTFSWQRGLKIGAGTYGKVYTVVNSDTGQLLAMKELSVAGGDRRALQRAAHELRLLEGVLHPHLVRYYGAELHREELLLFMELCVEGSLEALLARGGALPERSVRAYAKQLVSAVRELHSRNIVHRDIKSGNVFLTNEGRCLKLGDFGCAVRMRGTRTAAGELRGYVGTQAYMAPEVFMAAGHGRAADVWSLGCVVVEMASGERPFRNCDSSYQIMFLVGSGARPQPPDSLSHEGRSFCDSCLQHEPSLRPRADQLALHSFLMLQPEDDCLCEPGRLLVSSHVTD